MCCIAKDKNETVSLCTARTVESHGPLGLLSRADVDSQLRPLIVQLPGLAGISLSYDARGRLVEQQSSGNAGSDANPAQQTRTASLAYHASGHGAGLPASSTDALGQSTHYGYDAARRLNMVTLPDGRQHQYAYDANGNLTSLITAAGIEHRFHHDAVDLPTQYRAPASVTTWRYNRDRDLIGIDRPGGESIALAYDTAGRLRQIKTADDQLDWSWNTLGQPARVASQDATLTYQRTGTLVTGSNWSGAVDGQISVIPNRQQRLLPMRIEVRAGGVRAQSRCATTNSTVRPRSAA